MIVIFVLCHIIVSENIKNTVLSHVTLCGVLCCVVLCCALFCSAVKYGIIVYDMTSSTLQHCRRTERLIMERA